MQLSLFGLLLLTQPLHSSEQHTRANLEFSSNFDFLYDQAKTFKTSQVALMHSVPGSLYSFRFRFSQISVFYNKKFKKNRETAEFIPDQLRFHEKNFS